MFRKTRSNTMKILVIMRRVTIENCRKISSCGGLPNLVSFGGHKAATMDGPKIKQKSKFKVKHQKRKLFRANEPFFSVFMWGINYSVIEISHVNVPVMLLPADFKAFMKVKVDLQYFNQDVMPSNYKFKVYCPLVFKAFRDLFAISDRQWRYSLTSKQLVDPHRREKVWVSHDKKFIVHNISSEDVANLHYILPDIHKHYVETRGDTLLPKFVGLYRLSVQDRNAYLLVAKHILDTPLRIHELYLIKGSTVDRFASDKDKTLDPPVLKDNDLLSKNRSIYMGPEAKRVYLNRLKQDVEFLASLNIMDYSFMIGIHDCSASITPNSSNEPILSPQTDTSSLVASEGEEAAVVSHGDSSDYEEDFCHNMLDTFLIDPNEAESASRHDSFGEKKEIYFMGLVNILTFYGTRKKSYHLAKTAKYGTEAEISNVKPEQYAKRMLEFLDKIFV